MGRPEARVSSRREISQKNTPKFLHALRARFDSNSTLNVVLPSSERPKSFCGKLNAIESIQSLDAGYVQVMIMTNSSAWEDLLRSYNLVKVVHVSVV